MVAVGVVVGVAVGVVVGVVVAVAVGVVVAVAVVVGVAVGVVVVVGVAVGVAVVVAVVVGVAVELNLPKEGSMLDKVMELLSAKKKEQLVASLSAKEARRYSELKLLQKAGEIHNLELQPRFPLIVAGIKVCEYVADFSFQDENWKPVIEDVKSSFTRTLPVYRLKKKLFEALHQTEGLKITEV